MELLTVIAILGTVGIVAVSGLLGVKIRQKDPKHWKEEANYYMEQAKHWKGKFNAMNKKVMIEGEYNLEDVGEMGAAIGSIGDALEGVLPDGVRKLIKDPKIMNMVVGYAEKHPELAKKVIDGFIKKATGKSTNESDNGQLSSGDAA